MVTGNGENEEHDACWLDDPDDGCCALVVGHDGCCAFFCSICNGVGRLDCMYDDLGCQCGFCDGFGSCQECLGWGYFNEFGEPCHAGWDELRAYGTCDWGGCDGAAERFRWSDEMERWLPACAAHVASQVGAS